MSNNCRVGIIGGGVVGLSTALCLGSNHPNMDITVISDKDFNERTSFGPPGLFRPTLRSNEAKQWAHTSYDHYTRLARSADGPPAGVQLLSGYLLEDDISLLQNQEHIDVDLLTNFRWLNKREQEMFPVKFKHGVFVTTITAQGSIYVPWLAEQARLKGCKFAKEEIKSLSEVAQRFDILVNCSGLGARQLVGDESVYPVRGIAIKVHAPWIKHFLLCDHEETYVIPGIEHVFLGTVREVNKWNTNVTVAERQKILDRCAEIVPSLKKATFLDEWAGLRPYRPQPRVELDHVDWNYKKTPLIHNYGHGGNGFTLSWGSAVNVNEILSEHLRMKAKL